MIFNNIFVTFVIPAYNASRYIHSCLDSILRSEFKCFEVVVIDDGSIDDTFDILKEYSLKDSRIKVFTKNNEGQGVARNLGVQYAVGEYISFVDIDDILDEKYFDILIPNIISDDNFDFINFRMDFLTESGVVKHRLPYFDSSELLDDDIFNDSLLDKNIYSSPCNKLYKRSFLVNNFIKFPKVRKNEDIFFSRLVSYHAERCLFVNEILYHVNMTSGSTSRSMSVSSITDTLKIYNELESFLIKRGDYLKFKEMLIASKKKVFSNLMILCALRIENEQEYKESVRVFKSADAYADFISFSGFLKLSFKNRFMYVFILFGGRFATRYLVSGIARRLTY